MKVILLTDVPKVGNKYDVKDFKEGYAQNVLLSKGLAVLATKSELTKLDQRKEQMNKKREEEEKAFDSLISSVNGQMIVVKVKANDKGHLFKSVGPRDVCDAIKKIAGVSVDEDLIEMNNIKEVGTHSVIIKKGGKSGKCNVVVETQ